MTTTLNHIEIAGPAAPDLAAPVEVGALAALRDAVDTCADLDPDLLHSWTAAGRAVVTLAALAREAAAALGAVPGPVLHRGPGVVVVRDLVRAVTLLELAAGRPADDVSSERVDRVVEPILAAAADLERHRHRR